MELDRLEGGEDLGGDKGGETVVRIYYMKSMRKYIFK